MLKEFFNCYFSGQTASLL